MDINWKEISHVAGAGAVGGALSLVYSTTIGIPPVIEVIPWGVFAYLFLGAAAGIFGVYLIAKTDTSYAIHCLVFATACGLSWAPILDGASALVKDNGERALNVKVNKKVTDARSAIGKLAGASEQALSTLTTSVVEKVSDLTVTAAEVRDRQLATSVALSIDEAIEALKKAGKTYPSLAAKAIEDIRMVELTAGYDRTQALLPLHWSLSRRSVHAYVRPPEGSVPKTQ